jgi:hypothetical protein
MTFNLEGYFQNHNKQSVEKQEKFLNLNKVKNHKVIYVYLSQIEDRGVEIFSPAVGALGADVPGLPVAVHDGLQDGGKRGHPDPGTDQDGVLSSEYLDQI